MFSFLSVEDKWKILLDGPWHFNKALIVFKEPGEVGDIEKFQSRQADL